MLPSILPSELSLSEFSNGCLMPSSHLHAPWWHFLSGRYCVCVCVCTHWPVVQTKRPQLVFRFCKPFKLPLPLPLPPLQFLRALNARMCSKRTARCIFNFPNANQFAARIQTIQLSELVSLRYPKHFRFEVNIEFFFSWYFWSQFWIRFNCFCFNAKVKLFRKFERKFAK